MTAQDPPPDDGQPPVVEPEVDSPPKVTSPERPAEGWGATPATIATASASQWATAPPAGRSKSLWALVALAVVIMVLAIGCVGLIFIGGQIQKILAGTVEFGTSEAVGCSVGQRAVAFPSGTSVHVAGHLQRKVESGEVVAITISRDGTVLSSGSEATTSAGDCMIGALPGDAPSGHYRIEYLVGTEVLASGEFDIKP
jgi:hypothetical protein